MSQATTFDPVTSWKELYDRVESAWSGPIHEMLSSDQFAKAMGVTREQFLTGQKATKENLEAYWEQMRLPSKSDIARVASLVVGLENRLEAIEERVEAIASTLERAVAQLEKAAVRTPEPVVAVEIAETPAATEPKATVKPRSNGRRTR
jgi:polyhydroxyalkanoic acid synthase PhaR subunit